MWRSEHPGGEKAETKPSMVMGTGGTLYQYRFGA